MSATTWYIIAIVGFSLSGVGLIAAIFMFLKMNIPAIIGDLSGRTVAREIKAMRESNASSGDKLHRSSHVNIERGTLTEKVEDDVADKSAMSKAHSSKRLDRQPEETEKGKWMSGDETIQATEILSDNATEVLMDDAYATEILSSSTEILSDPGSDEVLYNQGGDKPYTASGTTVLNDDPEITVRPGRAVEFKIVKSIVEIHTDEVIE